MAQLVAVNDWLEAHPRGEKEASTKHSEGTTAEPEDEQADAGKEDSKQAETGKASRKGHKTWRKGKKGGSSPGPAAGVASSCTAEEQVVEREHSRSAANTHTEEECTRSTRSSGRKAMASSSTNTSQNNRSGGVP